MLNTKSINEAVAELCEKVIDQQACNIDSAKAMLKMAEDAYNRHADVITSDVNLEMYNKVDNILGIKSTVIGVSVMVGDTLEQSNIHITLMLTDLDKNDGLKQIGKFRTIPLSFTDYDRIVGYKKAVDKAENLLAEAIDIMNDTKAFVQQLPH